MRLIVCLIPLLFGCSTPLVRCDAHLQPINAPARPAAAAAAGLAWPLAPIQPDAPRREPR